MTKLEKTLVSGTAGTALMTLSSYLTSYLADEDFREPAHLTKMIARLAPGLSKQAKTIAGWGAHFAMGFIFAAIYVELWENKTIKHTIKNGIILGAISGVLGFLIWKATFKLHPFPSLTNYDKYYLQRIPAHIVFAIGATIAYRQVVGANIPDDLD